MKKIKPNYRFGIVFKIVMYSVVSLLFLASIIITFCVGDKDNNGLYVAFGIIAEIIGLFYFIVQDFLAIFEKREDVISEEKSLLYNFREFPSDIATLDDAKNGIKSIVNNSLRSNQKVTYVELRINEDNCSYELINDVYINYLCKNRKQLGIGSLTIEIINNKDYFETILKNATFYFLKKNILFVINRTSNNKLMENISSNLFVFIFQYGDGVNLDLSAEEINEIIEKNRDNLTEDSVGILKELSKSNRGYNKLMNCIDTESDVLYVTSVEEKLNQLLKERKFLEANEYFEAESSKERLQESLYTTLKKQYIEANIKHFLQKYRESLNINEKVINQCKKAIIDGKKSYYKSLLNDALFLKAHVLKHIGRFEDCYKLLINMPRDSLLPSQEYRLYRSLLSPLIFEYNIGTILNTNNCSELIQRLSDNFAALKDFRSNKVIDSNYFYYETYYPCLLAIKKCKDYDVFKKYIVNDLDKAIAFYEKSEPRLATNCYLIRASAYRYLFLNEKQDINYLEEIKKNWDFVVDVYKSNKDLDVLLSLVIESSFLYEVITEKYKNIIKEKMDCYKGYLSCANVSLSLFPYHKKFFDVLNEKEYFLEDIKKYMFGNLSLIP